MLVSGRVYIQFLGPLVASKVSTHFQKYSSKCESSPKTGVKENISREIWKIFSYTWFTPSNFLFFLPQNEGLVQMIFPY